MSEHARQEAVLPLEEIVARDPATALYLPLAERLLERGRLAEAIQLCEERRTRPGSGVGDHIVLGRAYLADGQLAPAKSEFEAALALDRENVVALKALGGILSHQGNHSEAASYYRAVCRVDPGDLESQTALHQITSGEFPEVRPADLVIGQGDLTWQPILLPREEEHLPELGLGLHTIESFDAVASDQRGIETFDTTPPVPYKANVQDFQELSIGRLDLDIALAPEGEPGAEAPPSDEVDYASAATSSAPIGPPGTPTEPRPPMPNEAPRRGALVEGNKSAFEKWVHRLDGSGS